MMPCNRLRYQWSNLRILFQSNNSPYIRMIWTCFYIGIFLIIPSNALNILLPFHLLFALIMK